jgi:hypothetical protein
MSKPLTQQQVFNRVLKHCRKQKERAMNIAGNNCVYLADDGKRCAIGCLLPDGPWLDERGNVAWLLKKHPTLNNLFAFRDEDFLLTMQSLHDRYLGRSKAKKPDSMNAFEERAQDIARKYKLRYPKPLPETDHVRGRRTDSE